MMFKNHNKGITLVELLVAIVILSVVIISFIGSFSSIAKGLSFSKAKTLATNLAQEKIQILRQLPYHRILITPSPSYLTDFSPVVPYDTEYFPPEDILEGGLRFKRYTYIAPLQEVNGRFEQLPPSTPEQGLKYIQVSVVYETDKRKKLVTLHTIITNPDISYYRGVVEGRVRDKTTFLPLKDVIITLAENIGCRDYTDSDGRYSIKTHYGNYSVVATKRGYYTDVKSVSVGYNPQTVDFDLQPISTGTVFGYVWLNDRVVISQVVGSTLTVDGFSQEYIELYNPTSQPIQMAINISSGIIGVKYQSTADGDTLKDIKLEYYTLSIPPRGYYLIANTNTITACGVTKQADAVFSSSNPDYPNIIKTKEENGPPFAGGGVGIYYIATGEYIDVVGWDAFNVNKSAPIYEKDGIDQNIGLEENEQYVRKTSTWGFISSWGNCYDSDNNNIDFTSFRKPMQVPPRNSSDILQPFAGRPAIGAIISCTDGFSGVTNAVSVGYPPAAYFELVSVATGSWSVVISSESYLTVVDNVQVCTSSKTGILNDKTSPVWYTPYHYSQLTEVVKGQGFISGRITNVLGQPLGSIKVVAGGIETFTNSQGFYMLVVSSGIYNVVANPDNLNTLYVSLTKTNIVVQEGQTTSGVDFVLSQGGRVTGFVSRDKINPLPGIVIQVTNIDGFSFGEDVSDNNGRFVIPNLSSGTYYIKPVLSSRESSSPSVSTVTVTAGVTVFAGTFTITGALGKISGKVTYAGKPISTGVLIIASTTTISVPPVISTSTLTGPPYFITSSYEDGRYILEVIGSTTTKYNLYGYYTTYDIITKKPTIKSKSRTDITVLPGYETSNQDLDF